MQSSLGPVDTQAHELSAPLLRQRRNLMASSLILAAVELTGAQFRSVSALGAQVAVQRPEVLNWFLIAFTVYFAYRYLLYLLQEPITKISSEFFTRLDRLLVPELLKLRDQQYPASSGASLEGALSLSRRGGPFRYDVQVSTGKDGSGGTTMGEIKVNLLRYPVKCLRAYVGALFLRSYFTDYYLPICIAIASWALAMA